jgi:hypothetical protein
MRIPLLDSSLIQDNRGVAPVIGFILLFGFLIIALSGYQAYNVPQQNSEVEFQHFQEVRNDLVNVRSSISTAGQADVSQYPTAKLGTNYPARIITINPPPPSGTLRTSQPYDIRIEEQSGGGEEAVSTRFLEYQNGYNELNIGSIWYENSVLYLDERGNRGGIAIYQDQNIIAGNDTARVTALQNQFSTSSTGRVTLNLYPAENPDVNISKFEGDLTIKIPSRLNGTTYWDEAIDTSGSDALAYQGTEPYPGESDIYWVVLTVDADALKFNTVGIDSVPENQASAKQNVGVGTQEGTGSETDPALQCEPGNVNGGGNEQFDNIAVEGSVNLGDNARVTGDIVANGNVNLNNNVKIDGDVRAGGSVSLSNNARVSGDVSAGGNINDNTGGNPSSGIQGSTNSEPPGYSPCEG